MSKTVIKKRFKVDITFLPAPNGRKYELQDASLIVKAMNEKKAKEMGKDMFKNWKHMLINVREK